MQESQSKAQIIWDLPTRIFHWLMVLSFLIGWLTFDDNRFLFLHVFAGYSLLLLIIFRLIWGFIGTHYARFNTFAHNWSSVTDYLKGLLNGKAMRYIGHNPAGGWAIFLILILGIMMGLTGMITLGGEEGHGLLKGLINFRTGILAHLAHEILAWTMLAVVIMHVSGVIIESVLHKENLIKSMITGKKCADAETVSIKQHYITGLLLFFTLIISASVYFRGYITESADHLYQPYTGPILPDSDIWREQCGECHYAYHPTLLPARSWKLIFAQQHDHFGEDLDLEEDDLQQLLAFHLRYSAEKLLSEPSRRILFSTPQSETPIRITETHYWIKKHHDIDKHYWTSDKVRSKGNCSACHLDQKLGTYEDSDMRLPD